MHAGVKIMERREEIRGGRSAEDSVSGNTMFRIRQPGAAVLAPHMRKRLLVVSNDDFRFLLGNGSARFEELSAEVRPSSLQHAHRSALAPHPPDTQHTRARMGVCRAAWRGTAPAGRSECGCTEHGACGWRAVHRCPRNSAD